jgi:LuxR family maltose regulon positive regulatory protein
VEGRAPRLREVERSPGRHLIRAKLFPPRLAADLIVRARLFERLESGHALLLTLVCAPAGYGKSTLVASWLRGAAHPFAWVSLDEDDGDLEMFVGYLVEAVRTVDPMACPETLSMLRGPNLHPVSLAESLANELSKLRQNLILVLDDYHVIHSAEVHELVNLLLRHLPRQVHLLLVARFDPPLSLQRLRAGGQMLEVRQQDLRFSASELSAFVGRALGISLQEKTLERLEAATEGWAVGLRLATLLARQADDVDTLLSGLRGSFAEMSDYLVGEVLNRQPSHWHRYLLTAALPKRFCAGLCDALVVPGEGGDTTNTGRAFIDWLAGSELFVVGLDDRREWFRYHRLFRGLLLHQLEQSRGPEEIAELRRRAAGWLDANGYPELALHHYLAAADPRAGAGVVKSHRHELTRREEWSRLERLLLRLPEEVKRGDLELLILEAWLNENRFRFPELLDNLEEMEALVAGGAAAEEVGRLRGEIEALRSTRHYLGCAGREAVAASRRALEEIPREHLSERGFALVLNALALQMTGKIEDAETVLLEALKDRSLRGSTYHGRILIGLCMVDWMEGNTDRVLRVAGELLGLGDESALPESDMFARYFLGVGHYERDALDPAREVLTPAVERRAQPNLSNFVHSSVALALVHLAGGEAVRAAEIATQLAARGLELQNPELLRLAEAFEAELAWRQGRLGEASRWAAEYRPEIRKPRFRFFMPELTLAKVLLAEDSEDSRRRAADLLHQLGLSLAVIHHRRFLIEVLALQALLADQQSDEAVALASLGRAIEAAAPRGLVRPLIDLGPPLIALLSRLEVDAPTEPFVEAILEVPAQPRGPVAPAGVAGRPGSAGDALVEPLSDRELEVLELLAERLSNKEIAARLFISSATVKRHNSNIFQKLQVGRRRGAVEKARTLGILPSA